MIIARNYLDVYPYENWKAKEVHPYQEGQRFQPSKLEMGEGQTNAPKPLTEADLIALMEKHGIGGVKFFCLFFMSYCYLMELLTSGIILAQALMQLMLNT